jgi:hypothetical protein
VMMHKKRRKPKIIMNLHHEGEEEMFGGWSFGSKVICKVTISFTPYSLLPQVNLFVVDKFFWCKFKLFPLHLLTFIFCWIMPTIVKWRHIWQCVRRYLIILIFVFFHIDKFFPLKLLNFMMAFLLPSILI